MRLLCQPLLSITRPPISAPPDGAQLNNGLNKAKQGEGGGGRARGKTENEIYLPSSLVHFKIALPNNAHFVTSNNLLSAYHDTEKTRGRGGGHLEIRTAMVGYNTRSFVKTPTNTPRKTKNKTTKTKNKQQKAPHTEKKNALRVPPHNSNARSITTHYTTVPMQRYNTATYSTQYTCSMEASRRSSTSGWRFCIASLAASHCATLMGYYRSTWSWCGTAHVGRGLGVGALRVAY